MDIKVYYMLIVLITRWQVLSFRSNLYVNTLRNTSQDIGVILSRNTCRKISSNAFGKKEEVVFIFVCNGKAEVAEKII